MILANSCARKMVIKWLSGTTQEINLDPEDIKEKKLLRRIEACKAMQIIDFTLDVGLPSRVLKVIKSQDFVDFKVESIAIPDHHLDSSKLLMELLKAFPTPDVLHTDVKSHRIGDTYKTLVRCWL